VLLGLSLLWLAGGLGSDLLEARLSHSEFEAVLAGGAVQEISIRQNRLTPTGEARIVYKGEEKRFSRERYFVSDVNRLQTELEERGIDFRLENPPVGGDFLGYGLLLLLTAGAVFYTFYRRGLPGGGAAAQIGRARARRENRTGENFRTVAGLSEEKEELAQLVDFLRAPEKYTELGARIPKGVLLVGPPGTGKTLLGRAIAGEAGVPFFSVAGSDFVELFVGVGASRVRELFEEAKSSAPCVVFIDEIDAVARRRGAGLGGGNDEREQTLNQLLVEMDGFTPNEGVIVLAATNRPDVLDPAILRPGRFDRKLTISKPDLCGREEILRLHAANKKFSEEVDFSELARMTAGFTGADLENLLNEAVIFVAAERRAFVTAEDLRRAFLRVTVGAEKRSRVISEEEKRITAYHEAGHALLMKLIPGQGPVHTVSIIPTGIGAAGYTLSLPNGEQLFETRSHMLGQIKVALGGRIAEELVFGEPTTGAAQDIKEATALARAMVETYGMSAEVGTVHCGGAEDEVFLGRDFVHTKPYSEATASLIDSEVKRITDECYREAKDIMVLHRDNLETCAALLLEKEKINGEEFEALFEGKSEESNGE
jgi:ATP-dependent metallopeptidase hflB